MVHHENQTPSESGGRGLSSRKEKIGGRHQQVLLVKRRIFVRLLLRKTGSDVIPSHRRKLPRAAQSSLKAHSGVHQEVSLSFLPCLSPPGRRR